MSLEGLLHYLAYSSIGHVFFATVSIAWHIVRRIQKHRKTARGQLALQHKREAHGGPLHLCDHHDCQPLRHL